MSGFANPRGLLHSAVPGRTDHIHAAPAANSYVIPADVVSGLGEGNTLAGARVLEMALQDGAPAHGHVAPSTYQDTAHKDEPGKVKCLLAGGEFVLSPEDVLRIGGGNYKKGHKLLDHLVVEWRKQIVKTMRGLKGPVRS